MKLLKIILKGLRTAGLIFLITLGLVVVLEGLVRVIYSEKADEHPFFEWLPERAYAFDPDYLVKLKPNMKKDYERQDDAGETVTWHTNAHGFRGPALQDNPDYRIVVYGDSMIQARFTEWENTYPAQLQHRLSQALNKNIEVLNAGIVAMGPDENLIRMQKEWPIFKPDMIIFTIFADNDFGDIIRNRLFHLNENNKLELTTFERKKDSLIISGIERLRINVLIDKLIQEAKHKDQQKNQVPDPYINDTQKPGWLVDRSRKEFENYTQNLPQKYPHFNDHYDIDIATDITGESAQIKLALMKEVLKEAKKICDENEIPILFVILPSSTDLTENIPLNHRLLSTEFPNYNRRHLTDSLVKSLTDLDANYLNLYDPFLTQSPEKLFFTKADNHWNDLGQILGASHTATTILNKKLISVQKTGKSH